LRITKIKTVIKLKNMLKYILLVIIVLMITTLSKNLIAQENVNQEVKVIKPYEPVIGDAFKISELPKIVDTNKVITRFDYEVLPVVHETGFVPKPISPARLISEPLSKLYYGNIKAGFGTYLSPLGEIYVGSKRSEKINWNAMLHHNSTHGKIKNEINEKVYAGFSNSSANGEFNYFTKSQKTLSFDTEVSNKINYYYGYNPAVVNDLEIIAPLSKDSIENQTINFYQVNSSWKTNYLDSSQVNYDMGVGWQGLTGKDGIGENVFKFNTSLDYFFEKEFVGADIALNYYTNSGIDDTINSAIVKFSPWIGAFGNKWRVVVGVSTFYDQERQTYNFYPRLSMHYNVIDYFLIPYFELNGNYNQNTYKQIYDENPFIKQRLGVKPTNTKLSMTFGFRGNISSQIAFNTKVNYEQINNQYFFVNDTSVDVPLQNKFNVVYDDIIRVRFLAEISYKTGENLFFSLKGNYYYYEMTNEAQPWHLPNFKLSLNTRYIIQNKIVLEANVFGLGKRYIKEFDENNLPYEKSLQNIIDLNLGIEYRMSKVFSAFAYLNNISSVKYYEWNHYPSQRFNVMLGLSYSF